MTSSAVAVAAITLMLMAPPAGAEAPAQTNAGAPPQIDSHPSLAEEAPHIVPVLQPPAASGRVRPESAWFAGGSAAHCAGHAGGAGTSVNASACGIGKRQCERPSWCASSQRRNGPSLLKWRCDRRQRWVRVAKQRVQFLLASAEPYAVLAAYGDVVLGAAEHGTFGIQLVGKDAILLQVAGAQAFEPLLLRVRGRSQKQAGKQHEYQSTHEQLPPRPMADPQSPQGWPRPRTGSQPLARMDETDG